MADPTDRLDLIAEKVYDLLTEQKDAMEIADIWFGEQSKIPRTPAVCVIPDGKRREPAGPPRRSKNTFRIHLDVYFFKVQAVEQNDRALVTLTDNIETVLHADMTLGGLVFGSMVQGVDSGTLNKDRTLFRGTRIVFEAESLTLLPMRPGYNQ